MKDKCWGISCGMSFFPTKYEPFIDRVCVDGSGIIKCDYRKTKSMRINKVDVLKWLAQYKCDNDEDVEIIDDKDYISDD